MFAAKLLLLAVNSNYCGAFVAACFKPGIRKLRANLATMIAYDTVSQAIEGLRTRGFTLDFNLGENCLICNNRKYNIADFGITEVYRFEGNTDPADEAVVYGVESTDGVKGTLVTGYGPSAEGMSAEMAKKLKVLHD